MRSIRDVFGGRGDRYDVRFTPDFEERVVRDVSKLFSAQLNKIQKQLDRMENNMAITVADVKAKLETLNAEVARNTDIDASVLAALNGNTEAMAALQKEIDALKAAGASAVTQEDLDALSASADATLTTLKGNNDTLAAKVTQGTPVA